MKSQLGLMNHLPLSWLLVASTVISQYEEQAVADCQHLAPKHGHAWFPLTRTRSAVGIVVDPEVSLGAEADCPKITAYGFLKHKLPVRFDVTDQTSLGETWGSSVVTVDRGSSAVSHRVEAGGNGPSRRDTERTEGKSRVVHGSRHCVFAPK